MGGGGGVSNCQSNVIDISHWGIKWEGGHRKAKVSSEVCEWQWWRCDTINLPDNCIATLNECRRFLNLNADVSRPVSNRREVAKLCGHLLPTTTRAPIFVLVIYFKSLSYKTRIFNPILVKILASNSEKKTTTIARYLPVNPIPKPKCLLDWFRYILQVWVLVSKSCIKPFLDTTHDVVLGTNSVWKS